MPLKYEGAVWMSKDGATTTETPEGYELACKVVTKLATFIENRQERLGVADPDKRQDLANLILSFLVESMAVNMLSIVDTLKEFVDEPDEIRSFIEHTEVLAQRLTEIKVASSPDEFNRIFRRVAN